MRINNAEAVNKFQEFNDETVHITTITLAELYVGAYRSNNVLHEVSKVDRLLQNILVLTLDTQSAKKYGELHYQLRSEPIGDRDLFIASIVASIVVSNNQSLLTKNVKHFERVPSLIVNSW